MRSAFEMRLLSMCSVPPHSALWLGTANGFVILVNSDTYSPITHLNLQTSYIRHLTWIPEKDATNGNVGKQE